MSATVSHEDTAQLNLVGKIREKLNEYTIHKLEAPDMFDLKDLQNFMFSGVIELPLIGPDWHSWGVVSRPESYCDDGLVGLRPRQHTDAFTSKLSERPIDILHCFKRLYRGKERDNPVVGYRDTAISKITFWLTSFITSILPVLSTIALVNIPSLLHRLAAIAGFNGLVSLCLEWFMEARRTDVFAITAIFAAIQVLFVGQAHVRGPQEVAFAPSSALPSWYGI
ncbi:hypothetical protein BKA58DRAFT_401949 [Alternaria rosae]|uniref:uncharacterized protein n=1 Tax=Alternaria rosae TaxID=1187941 RepID=UPI001E8E89ED|nr:uncharacterized protein BKA58DRAFT_401949 [Alternaria rosae]KAH6870409.1 hypothetical protein BKA58DRAFT_401949 [Alternaria rosae]